MNGIKEPNVPFTVHNMSLRQSTKSELLGKNVQEFNRFLGIYEPQIVVEDKGSKIILGKKHTQQCRFCERRSPDVIFKKKAHVMPQALGNRNVLSLFECDSCNEDIFSNYESSLAHFIGVIRTLAGIKGRRGIPTHKENKSSLRVEFLDDVFTISAKKTEATNHAAYDKENNQFTLNTITQPYYPLRVYKSLAKIAYCLLEEKELNNFRFIHRLLMSDELDEKVGGLNFIRLFWYFFTGGVNVQKPSAILFKRRLNLDDPHFFEKILVVRFANVLYQIFILSDKDLELAKLGNAFTGLRFTPPINQCLFFDTDLTSPDKKPGSKQSLIFSVGNMKEYKHTGAK